MSGNLHLSDLLKLLKMEPVDDKEGCDILIPVEVVEEIQRETPKRQAMIVQGLLELKYNPLAAKTEIGDNMYTLNVKDTRVVH